MQWKYIRSFPSLSSDSVTQTITIKLLTKFSSQLLTVNTIKIVEINTQLPLQHYDKYITISPKTHTITFSLKLYTKPAFYYKNHHNQSIVITIILGLA